MPIPKDTSMPQLAGILERIGKTKKKAIVKHLADETNTKPAEVEKALPGVQSAFRGAEVAQAKGMNPQAVGVAGLQKMDPTASQEPKKAPSKADANNQELLTVALLGTLPSLVSYAIAGPTAGAITAQGSSKIGEMYMSNARRKEDLERKDKALEIQADSAKALLAKRNADAAHQKKMEEFRGREVTAKENKLSGVDGGKPPKLTSGQMNRIADHDFALKAVDDLDKIIDSNKDIFGPVSGRARLLSNYDTKANAVNAAINKLIPMFGRSLEGGVLNEADYPRYKEIVGGISNPVDLAKEKASLLRRMILQKRQADLNAYKSAGINMSRYEDITPTDTSIHHGKDTVQQELPPMPDFDKMTEEELKKYLEQKR
jgi:hypothetical protein